ncbi:type II toxin-antitoxin system HipA family toxin [Desulfosarcina widdelii]|nr:HipA domain-containing protein [Desulfosarcina widdelii]
MARENSAYVFIHLGGTWLPCGYLTIFEDGRQIVSTFQYGRKYLQRPDAMAIDPVQLPLGETLFRSTPACPLFGGIRDAAPDGWGRHLLDRAAEPRSPGEFEYLTALPVENRTGALGFGRSLEEGPAPIDPGWENYPPRGATLDLADMIAAADRIDQGEALSPRHRRFLLRGSSLGGAQPKAPTLHGGRQWIAKFGREREAWNTCRIEHANLRLAARCRIDVPDSKVLTVGDRDVFLIERFDRDASGDPIPFISAATLLATDRIDTGSYQEIAVQMRKYVAAPNVAEDLKQLFMRMVFNILCNNADDHLRNHGFIHQPGHGWRLSPAYDVVPQPDMGPGVPRNLTLGVGMDGSRRATLENALSVCPVFGLPPEDGRQIIDRLKQTFLSEWPSVYARFGVSKKDFPFLEEAFVNHLM